jgi:hypothetical protein
VSRPAAGPTRPIQLLGALFVGVKQPGCEVKHLHVVQSLGMCGAIQLLEVWLRGAIQLLGSLPLFCLHKCLKVKCVAL